MGHESSLPTIYPICQDPEECSKLKCEDKNGKCAYDENGQYRCICKNEHHNFPLCSKFAGCFPACEEDEVCVKSGGSFLCRCKNGNGIAPCDSENVCTEPLKEECKKNNAKCITDSSLAKCVCLNGQDIYPYCNTEIQGPECPCLNGKCQEDSAGR